MDRFLSSFPAKFYATNYNADDVHPAVLIAVICSILVIVFGICIYNYKQEKKRKKAREADIRNHTVGDYGRLPRTSYVEGFAVSGHEVTSQGR